MLKQGQVRIGPVRRAVGAGVRLVVLFGLVGLLRRRRRPGFESRPERPGVRPGLLENINWMDRSGHSPFPRPASTWLRRRSPER